MGFPSPRLEWSDPDLYEAGLWLVDNCVTGGDLFILVDHEIRGQVQQFPQFRITWAGVEQRDDQGGVTWHAVGKLCNGVQHLAELCADRVTGERVNLTNFIGNSVFGIFDGESLDPQDVYRLVVERSF